MKYEDFSDYSSPNILNEKFYSFTLGNAQFIILNSNGLYNTTEQTTWLGNKLAVSDVNPDIDFVFTFSHQPGLTELWPDGNTSYVWSNVMGAIAQYPKATIHFGGHSHCYERGYYYGTSTQKRDFRTVVSGGMGGTLDRWGDYSNQTNYQTTHRSLDHYNYVIIDVDIDSKSYSGKTFSMGHPQKSLANVLVDFWHGKANQAAPEAPLALYPYLSANTAPVLIASPFSGLDTLFSSQFQISASEGNWLNPVFNSIRDMENYYGSTGNPDYYPVDMNTNIDIQRCAVTAGLLTSGTTYWWRVRYRDKNLRWSNWSLDQAFTVEPNLADAADFTADVTSGNLPLTVHFTDISNNSPLSWEWDFDNDGVIDSYEQDPVFTYTSPGLYSVALTSYFSTQNLTETKTNYINVLPSNVDFNSEKTDFVIYPNPVDKILMLDFISDEIAKEISISISDLSGRKILEFTKSCSNKVFLDVSMFDSGIYILKVQNENKEYKRMIFIVK
ncbi:MAG: hypothetical protein A2275_06920 [Bacteroidetes bacterium RIFOXYA12_FULL_35_11]|nr:MAG: hypothetical protein A2275_06920 [Bacteroidetes bacterium RIFOXYA12_FULL_35_11]